MKNITLKEVSSVATTILTAVGAGYAGLANIWGFPYADKTVASIAVIVSVISAVLGAFTIKKVSERIASGKTPSAPEEKQETSEAPDDFEFVPHPDPTPTAPIPNDIAIPKGDVQ